MFTKKLNYVYTNIWIIMLYCLILLPLGVLISKTKKLFSKKVIFYFDKTYFEFTEHLFMVDCPQTFKRLIKDILLDIGYYFSWKYRVINNIEYEYNE